MIVETFWFDCVSRKRHARDKFLRETACGLSFNKMCIHPPGHFPDYENTEPFCFRCAVLSA